MIHNTAQLLVQEDLFAVGSLAWTWPREDPLRQHKDRRERRMLHGQ
jgi:hypothetical protein